MTETAERRTTDLPRRLREETADLHRRVEDAVGLPGSVRSRDDYVDVLGRFLRLHEPLEKRLSAVAWRQGWTELGIELGRHRRAHLLADDLKALAAAPSSRPAPPLALPRLRTFGEALGCLYVLEGSSLGGRMLAPAIRSVVGNVPVRFLMGEDRAHPGPWQDLRTALHRVAAERADEVVLGAGETFAAFAIHLAGSTPAEGMAG